MTGRKECCCCAQYGVAKVVLVLMLAAGYSTLLCDRRPCGGVWTPRRVTRDLFCSIGATMSGAANAIDEEWVEKKLKSANGSQDSVQSLSLWALNHKTQHEKIVAIWFKVLKTGTTFRIVRAMLRYWLSCRCTEVAGISPRCFETINFPKERWLIFSYMYDCVAVVLYNNM